MSELIREREAQILGEWERNVRSLAPAAHLDRPTLLDHVPELLAHIAAMADDLAEGRAPALPKDVAERHALERLDEGFDVGHVLLEFALLRDAIMALWQREELPPERVADLRVFNQAIDRAVLESVARYTQARERAIQALDRIAVATFASVSMGQLLEELLRVLVETTPAIDTASILLVEGGRLRVRASVGLDEEVEQGFSLAFGEGFAGTIAAESRARFLADASTNALVKSAVLRKRGVRALYGVPLVDGDVVIGVVQIGSLTARQFSEQDKRLLAVAATRATSAIRQQLLKDAEEKRARELAVALEQRRELETIVSCHSDLMYLVDRQHRITYANPALLAVFGKRLDQVVGGTFADLGHSPRVAALLDAHLDEALAGRTVRGDAEETTGSRGKRAYEFVLVPVVGPDGRIHAVAGTTRDITERKSAHDDRARLLDAEKGARLQAESALAVLEALLAARSVGIAVLDTELRYVRTNEALAALNGVPPADHIGRTVREVLPEAGPLLEPVLANVLATGEPIVNLEVESTTASSPDAPRWFLANYFPIRTADGRTLGIGGVVVEITTQKRAFEERQRILEQLDAERGWLTAVLDQLPAGVLLADTASGHITYWNRRAEEIAGDAPSRAERVTDYAQRRAFDATGRELAPEEFPLARAVRGESVTEQDLVLPRRDETRVVVRASAGPVRDAAGRVVGGVVAFDDITERRRAEEAQHFLQEATGTLSRSLDFRETLASLARLAVPRMGDWCGVEIVTGEGRTEQLAVEHVDPAKVALARELRLQHPPDPDAPQGVRAVIRSGVPELYPHIADELLERIARTDQHLRGLRELGLRSAMIVPMIAHGRTLGAITFVSGEPGRYAPRDLALAQELAARAALALDNARLFREAGDALRAREEILAVVSHDLRNPLNAIHMAATLLMRPPPEPRARKQLETIQRAASRMDHLIGDLLDLASIQGGRLAVEQKPEEGEPLVAEAMETQEPSAKEKGIRLERAGDLGGVLLCCDRERVLQVFANLLGNAVKFCGSGDVVTITCEVVSREARFAVADTGPGIPDDELPHVFDPYWSAKRHAKKGTGLGLYITKGIVEAHGGRIWVEGGAGRGATFCFTLPLVAQERLDGA